MAVSESKPDAPVTGAGDGVDGASPAPSTSPAIATVSNDSQLQKVINYLLQRFPQMLYTTEGDEDWMVLVINLGDIILSSADIEWLLRTPHAFEIELFDEDGELVCQIYFEKEEVK
jgi:hypothetical protein